MDFLCAHHALFCSVAFLTLGFLMISSSAVENQRTRESRAPAMMSVKQEESTPSPTTFAAGMSLMSES